MLVKPGLSFIPAIDAHARYRGKQTAVVCGDKQATWAEFNSHVNKIANALLKAGLKKGDKVSLLSLNSIETLSILFGIMRAGGVSVPLSALLTSDLIASLINDSESCFLFADAILQPLVTPVLNRLKNIPEKRRISIDFEDENWISLNRYLEDSSDNLPEVHLEDTDMATIIYSSGTTGVPKGIVHNHQARAVFAYALGLEFRIDNTARTLITTPLFTNGTWLMLLPTIVAGGTVIMMQSFDPKRFLELAQIERCTHTFMVPTQFQAVIDSPDFVKSYLSTMRVMLCAGAILPLPIKNKILEKVGDVLMELYGLTEGMATTLKIEEVRIKTGSVGTPISGTEIRITDDQGIEVAPGEIGEIVGTGPGGMEGYHNRPEATRETIWKDDLGRTYIRTGDMGRFDDDGYLYIMDRKKDMIISGGANIFASDLEQVLLEHPQVKDTAVIAIPHEKWGETPLALIILRDGATDSEEEIKAWANAKLAKYQQIRRVAFQGSDFPRNAMGKVLKKQLREAYQEV